MEPNPAGGAGRAAEAQRGPTRPAGRGGEILPLAALTITTLMLAASAFRVVASSIAEPRVIGPALRKPVEGPCAAGPADEALPEMDAAEVPLAEDPPVPAPPEPEPPRTAATAALPKPSVASVAPPAPPGPSPAPDRSTPAPPPPTAAEPKKSISPPGSPQKAQVSPARTIPTAPRSDARRVVIRDDDGQPVVARILGRDGDRTAVLLPNGEVGWPDGLIYTDKPFVPATKATVRDRLLAREFAGFRAIETKHYVVLYQGSKPFAQASASLLENLYSSLGHALNRRDVPVHEAEFPLVAVIFRTEDDFRRRKPAAPDVQAYYDMLSNRIYLYESSRKDQAAPEVSALRKPQTVAHEGTHQVLQNIGVQPRLSSWPLWLVEGLAEYCATPKFAKNGAATWAGLGQVNVLHMATLRDLEDPLSTTVPGAKAAVIARDPRQPMVEYLVTRSELTPTDYALSWALTYHLAMKRLDDFLDYVREMSKLAPLEQRSPEDQLRAFRAAFGPNLGKLDAAVGGHLRKLKVDAVPYYAVMFEQPLGNGMVRRAAMISQSPSMIRQWLESTTNPGGAQPRWQILPHPTKARALLAAEQWMGSGG